jgi:hypothetical protein
MEFADNWSGIWHRQISDSSMPVAYQASGLARCASITHAQQRLCWHGEPSPSRRWPGNMKCKYGPCGLSKVPASARYIHHWHSHLIPAANHSKDASHSPTASDPRRSVAFPMPSGFLLCCPTMVITLLESNQNGWHRTPHLTTGLPLRCYFCRTVYHVCNRRAVHRALNPDLAIRCEIIVRARHHLQ